MRTLFSTTQVHPRDRFAYWHEVACKTLVDHHAKPDSCQTFRAELHADMVADVGLVVFENSPMVICHTDHHAAHVGDELFLCRQVAGGLALEQDGRDVVLEPGDMTLLDTRLPYAGRFAAGSRLLVLKVPRRALEARIGNPREIVALALSPAAPDADDHLA